MKHPNEAILPRFLAPGEDWSALVDRVSAIGAARDRPLYRELISSGSFVPAGQILRGAGRASQVLYNCFVTAVQPGEAADDVARRVTKWTADGAGVGVNLDALARTVREKGGELESVVRTIAASQQGLWDLGVRRTATMITLSLEDPDALRIARLLTSGPQFRHLNLGILVRDNQMQAMVHDETAPAAILRALASQAWVTGNPGLIFIDSVRRDHPFPEVVDACNPCAEQFLAPEEGCNLGSLNLSSFVVDDAVDWAAFDDAVAMAVRYLDDVVSVSEFPSAKARELAQQRRRIGLGIMGFATALGRLRIPYGSAESISLAREWGVRLKRVAEATSRELARDRGAAPAVAKRRRNSHLLSIAPTGAVSLLWRVSSGIEPYFDRAIANESLQVHFPDVFAGVERFAEDVAAPDQIEITAAWQESVDGGISKTVNLPETATVADVLTVFRNSWSSGCKAISVFRTNSRPAAISRLGMQPL